jgi:hypothetical protein
MQKRFVSLVAALGLSLGTLATYANATCNTITAPTITLKAVDCTQEKVWTTLQASGQFPDVFFPPGKTTSICYASFGPVPASIGQHQVTIASTLSGFTTDFVPTLFGGQDNLGTVVTQLTIVDPSGNDTGKLFTRDTIDFSQITTTGTALSTRPGSPPNPPGTCPWHRQNYWFLRQSHLLLVRSRLS